MVDAEFCVTKRPRRLTAAAPPTDTAPGVVGKRSPRTKVSETGGGRTVAVDESRVGLRVSCSSAIRDCTSDIAGVEPLAWMPFSMIISALTAASFFCSSAV